MGPGANNSLCVDLLRLAKPDLRAWATSMSFGRMDTTFVEMVRRNIYVSKVNALIPWAYIPSADGTGSGPNPGTAFRVDGKGDYAVEPGDYLLKWLSRAGQPGMAVADVASGPVQSRDYAVWHALKRRFVPRGRSFPRTSEDHTNS